MSPARSRRRPRRARRQRTRPIRRLLVGTAVALLTAAVGLALLVRASRPKAKQPFRFPAAAQVTPTAEIDASERARLQAVLEELRKTPGAPQSQR